jgi:hypothetical protein
MEHHVHLGRSYKYAVVLLTMLTIYGLRSYYLNNDRYLDLYFDLKKRGKLLSRTNAALLMFGLVAFPYILFLICILLLPL